MKKIIKLASFLAIIAALATGVLAGVNNLTAPIIEQNAQGENTAALKELYPDAEEFKTVEFTDESGNVKNAYKVDDVAYVFVVESDKGYNDKMSFILGFDMDGSNSKFKMTSNNESPGFGKRLIEEAEYTSQMTGKSTSDEIYLLSGATVSSQTMKKAIENTVKVFNSLSGNTSNPKPASNKPKDEAEIVSSVQDGNKTIVTVKFKGFAGENTFEVTLDEAQKTVLEVKAVSMNDTPEIGNALVGDKSYLGKFTNVKFDEITKVDVASGATVTSDALKNALQVVIDSIGVSDTPLSTPANVEVVSEAGDVAVVKVKVKGFAGENTFEITLNKAERKIVSVKVVSMNDTPEIGNDLVGNQKYLDKYNNVSFDEFKSVDAASGATVTSDSLKEAISQAIEAVKK